MSFPTYRAIMVRTIVEDYDRLTGVHRGYTSVSEWRVAYYTSARCSGFVSRRVYANTKSAHDAAKRLNKKVKHGK